MPPFNYNAAMQFPFVAQDTGYSPVAELLQTFRNRPTTSSILPFGPDVLSLLQGIGALQEEMQESSGRRFGIVRDRMQEALRQAEEDALARRLEKQNKLLAEQNRLAQVRSSGYSSPSVGYTGPTYTPSLNNNFPQLQPFPRLPTADEKPIVFPRANPQQKPIIAPPSDLNTWLQNYMNNKNKKKSKPAPQRGRTRFSAN